MPKFLRNFVVKTVDGKVAGVQKALKAAGIEVTSVIEVYKEAIPEPEESVAEEAPAEGAENGDTAPPVEQKTD